MPEESIFTTEVICAIITLGGIIFANLTSRWVAKEAAKKEMEKLKQTWEHDNEIAFDQAFHAMTEAVSTYILDSSTTNQEAARVKTAIMLTYAEGELADKTETLYTCLKCRPAPHAEEWLMDVIRARRSQRNNSKPKKKWFNFLSRAKS